MNLRTMAGATLLALLLFTPIVLQAQQAGQQYLFHVDIPFAFTAAGNHLPAGHYHVYHPGDPNLLILQKDDNLARAVAIIQEVFQTAAPPSEEEKKFREAMRAWSNR